MAILALFERYPPPIAIAAAAGCMFDWQLSCIGDG